MNDDMNELCKDCDCPESCRTFWQCYREFRNERAAGSPQQLCSPTDATGRSPAERPHSPDVGRWEEPPEYPEDYTLVIVIWDEAYAFAVRIRDQWWDQQSQIIPDDEVTHWQHAPAAPAVAKEL